MLTQTFKFSDLNVHIIHQRHSCYVSNPPHRLGLCFLSSRPQFIPVWGSIQHFVTCWFRSFSRRIIVTSPPNTKGGRPPQVGCGFSTHFQLSSKLRDASSWRHNMPWWKGTHLIWINMARGRNFKQHGKKHSPWHSAFYCSVTPLKSQNPYKQSQKTTPLTYSSFPSRSS